MFSSQSADAVRKDTTLSSTQRNFILNLTSCLVSILYSLSCDLCNYFDHNNNIGQHNLAKGDIARLMISIAAHSCLVDLLSHLPSGSTRREVGPWMYLAPHFGEGS